MPPLATVLPSITTEDEELIRRQRQGDLHAFCEPLYGVRTSPNAKGLWQPIPARPIDELPGCDGPSHFNYDIYAKALEDSDDEDSEDEGRRRKRRRTRRGQQPSSTKQPSSTQQPQPPLYPPKEHHEMRRIPHLEREKEPDQRRDLSQPSSMKQPSSTQQPPPPLYQPKDPHEMRRIPHLEREKESQQRRDLSSYSVPVSRRQLSEAKTVLLAKYRFRMSEPYTVHSRIQAVVQGPGEEGEVVEGLCADAKPVVRRMGLIAADRTEETTEAIRNLHLYVVMSQTVQLFSPLWDDLAPHHRCVVTEHSRFQYRRLANDCHVIGIQDQNLVDQWYVLVLYDARAVVEVFYQLQLDSIRKIVQYLAGEGIPFATAKPTKRLPRGRAFRTEWSLGYREAGYKFDRTDYDKYEQKKEEILSDSVGRAAIGRGGIIWRLAVDSVDVKKRVAKGPTSGAAWQGGEVGGGLDGHSLVDDVLLDEEADALVGSYKTYTGFGQQTEDLSWWPKASVWAGSGHNMGYWTADNEAWFQRRREEIQKGGKPLNGTAWRKFLANVRVGPVKRFSEKMNGVCDKFLQGDDSYWQA